MSPRDRRAAGIGLGLLLLLAGVPAVGTAAAAGVELVAIAPNPTAPGDAGEHLVLEFGRPTAVDGWTVGDGESVARFPDRTLAGRVVATTEPSALPPVEGTVVRLTGRLALANGGDEVVVRRPGGVVAAVAYRDAPEGQHYVRGAAGWAWRRPGATDLPVATARDVPARLFVLPDAPAVPVTAIDAADERVLVGAYTFTSRRAARGLCAAADRGARVALLVEGEPVGGMPRRQAPVLDRLVACGVGVSVLGGPGDRYAVHHPKYAVLDDRALVMSENWKPAGTGGRSSRGWGVLLDSPRVADALARTFAADAGFRDARPWPAVRDEVSLAAAPAANGSYPTRFRPARVEVDRVEVLLAPDTAGPRLLDLLEGASGSVALQGVGVDDPFVNATVRAARRGVRTRVLVSGAWYVRADNRRLVDRLNRRGRTDGLPLRARTARPRSRFAKTHVKGLLVDREAAVVGSLNWNGYATRRNREVVVVLHDPEAAAYYGRIFEADWRGGTWRLPVGFGLAVVAAAVGSAAGLRRSVRFEDADEVGVGPAQSAW